ncbi:hypothetical protein Tco_1392545 [Tanacetum coccineum]
MAKTYVSRLKDTELETLIATYDIPLDLRPRLPDPNFRMINLPVGDRAIGIYSRIFDSSGVRIPFSSFLLAVLKYFKVHISQLVPLGLSKVIIFEVLCRSLNIEPTVTLFRVFQTLSKHGDWFSFAKRGDHAPVCMEVAKSRLKLWKEKFFLIDRRAILFHMPWRHPDSCITDKVPSCFNQNHVDRLKAHIMKLRDIPKGVTVWEEPHGLDTCILGRVADCTTSPAPAGTAVPRASPEEVAVTRPDRKVVTKVDYTDKRKASTGPEISTNAAKKTRLSKKGSGAGSSGQVAEDEVELVDDGTLDDEYQYDDSEFIMEGIESLNDVNEDKEVEPAELSGGVRRATRVSLRTFHGISEDASPHVQEAAPAPDTQPLVADAGADKVASDGNVDPYYDARVGNTARDVLEIDLLPIVLGPYYIPYPYDKGSGSESPPYTKDAWEEIHGVNLAETHRLRQLSSVELSFKKCAQQTQTIKKQSADLRQQNESTVRANEEVYRNERDTLAIEKENIKEELAETKSQLEHRGRQAEEIQGSITSFFQSDFTPLVRRLLKSGEFNRAFTGVLNTTISVGVELASYTNVAEAILKDIDNNDDHREVGSMMGLGYHVLLFMRLMFGSAGSSRAVKDSLFVGEAYDKVFNHLDLLHSPLEGKGNLRHWKAWIRSLIYDL